MSSVMTILTVLFSVILTPFLIFFCGIVILAALGKTLGVRRLYVKLLLRVFEFGRESIEKNQRRKNSESDDESNGLESLSNKLSIRGAKEQIDSSIKEHDVDVKCAKDMPGQSSVITRQDFILLPEPAVNNSVKETAKIVPDKSTQTGDNVNVSQSAEVTRASLRAWELKREFELADVLDYIKTGVEAIIEDQVTSRFEAQELKSWNLLTRTNRNYEFINWRITVIWFIGFWIRYAFLLPLRVLICFFGVSWALTWTFCLSVWPDGELKRFVGELASLVTFRLFALCISAVINTHHVQWKPRRGGVCVANHTTPADAVILSTETAFSLVVWLAFCTAAVGYVPKGRFKRWLNERVSIMCFQVLSSALSLVITYHNVENRPKIGICVANHTSPIDCLVVACDNCYSLIGQRHGGFLGILQRALARASPHIWFERDEVKDREAVAERIRRHVSDPHNPPILIFPEGTCINNTSVMQFKKGSFEVGSIIYPVAIKYDLRFGDAFWNSSKYSMIQYLYMMMTSWAIVCDVWYLPPMTMHPNESAVQFANRVKRAIAEQGGLVDLMWDGQLKRMKPKKEWKERHQEEFSKRLKLK